MRASDYFVEAPTAQNHVRNRAHREIVGLEEGLVFTLRPVKIFIVHLASESAKTHCLRQDQNHSFFSVSSSSPSPPAQPSVELFLIFSLWAICVFPHLCVSTNVQNQHVWPLMKKVKLQRMVQ